MGKYLKKFSTDPERVEYEGGGSYLEPYVSYVDGDNTVHYNKPKETRVIAVFNVTDISSPTKIGYNQFTSAFTEIEIDGVVQSTVVSAYTFDTLGEHTVKYTLANPTSIGGSVFNRCSDLTSITIPNSVTSIGNAAFQRCSGLTNINIPSGVISIGDGAFDKCATLSSATIGNSVTSIGQGAFYDCASLTSVTIPNGVTSIGASAFVNCSGLTSVIIGSGLTSIGAMAFLGCNGLTSIAIPDSVTSIEDAAFLTCSGLTNVTIGSGVTNIKIAAFQACSNLSSVTVEATTPPTLGTEVFINNASGRKIYVPSESVNAYKAATNWSDYAADIEAIP